MQEVRPQGRMKAGLPSWGIRETAGRTGLGKPGSLRPGSSVRVSRCSLVQALGPPDRNERTQGTGSYIQELEGSQTKAGAGWEPMSKVGPWSRAHRQRSVRVCGNNED